MKDNIKRLGLYFNMDNPVEKQMWDYICKGRKKSEVIKRLIEEKINEEIKHQVKNDSEKNEIIKKEMNISKKDILNCEGINF